MKGTNCVSIASCFLVYKLNTYSETFAAEAAHENRQSVWVRQIVKKGMQRGDHEISDTTPAIVMEVLLDIRGMFVSLQLPI